MKYIDFLKDYHKSTKRDYYKDDKGSNIFFYLFFLGLKFKDALEDVNRVAKEILSKDRLVTLLVGDRSVIEEQIKTLGWDICLLDHNGRIITN